MTNDDSQSLHRVSPDAFREVVRRIEARIDQGEERIVHCPAALDRLENDVELFQDLLGFYFADAPTILTTLHTAVAEGNADAVHRTAHRLKGLLAHFDAQPAIVAAARLETMGRQGTIMGAQQAAEQLDREVERVTLVLREFCPPETD